MGTYIKINGPNSPYILIAGGPIGYMLGYIRSVYVKFNHTYGMVVNYSYSPQCLPVAITERHAFEHKSIRKVKVHNSIATTFGSFESTSYYLHKNQYVGLTNSNVIASDYYLHQNVYHAPVDAKITEISYWLHQQPYTGPVDGERVVDIGGFVRTAPSDPASLINDFESIVYTKPPVDLGVIDPVSIESTVQIAPSQIAIIDTVHNAINHEFVSSKSVKRNSSSAAIDLVPESGPILPITPDVYHATSDTGFDLVDSNVIFKRKPTIKQKVEVVATKTSGRVVVPYGSIGSSRKPQFNR